MIDLTNGLDMTRNITEGIVFGGFDSKKHNMWLVDRSAPTPSEKSVLEDIPYMQGVYDFSFIMGERVYTNRPIVYTFHIPQDIYMKRKFEQTSLENSLMNQGIVKLTDSYTPGYSYRGKCVSVDTEDDHVYNRLIVSVEFEVYPFKISDLKEGHDIWDDINFELDILQPVSFEVSGARTISLLYNGAKSVSPRITASAPFEVKVRNITVSVPSGVSKNDLFRLRTGENTLQITGNGSISFDFFKELI